MPAICLITALPSEARPLIKHFRLNAVGHKHLRLFQAAAGAGNANQNGTALYLLQCGIGKLNAAADTAAMLQLLPSVDAVINVGIAGSERPLGETIIAHCVQDNASSRQWYPHLPSSKIIGNTVSVQVQTVDKPADNYTHEAAFDMEASGIVQAASKVLDLAFIHSVKVVSDNGQSSIERITSESVAQQVASSITVLEKLMAALPFDSQPNLGDIHALSEKLQAHIHFSSTEQHNLNQLLQRHKALLGQLPDDTSLLQHATAKSLRRHLVAKLDNAKIAY